MSKIDFAKLKIGDRLVRTKGGIFTKHHVIYAGKWDEQHLIAENQIDVGVRYLPLDVFVNEGTIVRVEHNDFDENSQMEIINRINNKIGTSYSLTNYNCEHFTNDIITGVKESKQVKTAVVIATIGFALYCLAFKSPNSR